MDTERAGHIHLYPADLKKKKNLSISMFLLTITSKRRVFQFISYMGLNFGKASIYQNSTVFGGRQRNQDKKMSPLGRGEENNPIFDKSTSTVFAFCSMRHK